MVANPTQLELGIGIYTPRQAAAIARISPQTMSRLMRSRESRPAVQSQDASADRVVSFLDLVQAMAIRAIRRQRKVSLDKIKEFIAHAQESYGVEHPFARRHKTYLFGDEIVLQHNDQIIQLTGAFRHQDLIRPVVELYMQELSFDAAGLAKAYTPLQFGERSIVIDPTRRMGQPLVMPCGYSVEALLASFHAEGTIEKAAEVNAVDPEDVRLALRYDDYLAGVAA
jgi:uncharacterized protein (DUF433 family)